jgi:outer membrane protein assembly factor BamA
MNFSRAILILLVIVATQRPVYAQDSTAAPAFRRWDIFPAISYAPETKLTLGIIGLRYFNFGKPGSATPLSNLEFLAVYTLREQILLESRWEFFLNESRWRIRGEVYFNRYPDRNYGVGNHAAAQVMEVDEDGKRDTLNYWNFNSDRVKFSPVVLRQVLPHLFVGLQYDMESLYHVRPISDEYAFLNPEAQAIATMPVSGVRSGLGIQLLYDSRDYIMNPLHGSFAEVNLIRYGSYLGSDYTFTSFSADLRHYINVIQNQTLALRVYASRQGPDGEVPMRALSRVGGYKFVRGYFSGTYQDVSMTAFEAEYRLPLWKEGSDSRLWQVWKRLGLVAFIGGAQVAKGFDEIQLDQFNLATGGGLRILFNPKTRLNIRIDYAVALADNSAGPGQRQTGLYFYLAESF